MYIYFNISLYRFINIFNLSVLSSINLMSILLILCGSKTSWSNIRLLEILLPWQPIVKIILKLWYSQFNFFISLLDLKNKFFLIKNSSHISNFEIFDKIYGKFKSFEIYSLDCIVRLISPVATILEQCCPSTGTTL